MTIDKIKIGDFAEQVNIINLEDAFKYAEITGDNNPIHFDSDEAKKSLYGKPIAHGMILPGFISGIIGTKLPGIGCIYAEQTIKFLKPVYYGDRITTRITVRDINVEKNRVYLRTECFNQKNECVINGEAIVLPNKKEEVKL